MLTVETDLAPIKMALARCAEGELFALIDATNEAPQVAPGLLAWLEAACMWEWHRRTGKDYELQPPEAAIPDDEDAVSIDAAIALRGTFAQNSESMRTLFEELERLLTGEGRRQ